MKHSKLPWKIDGRFIVDADGEAVCDLDYFHTPNNKGNAALIVGLTERLRKTEIERDNASAAGN